MAQQRLADVFEEAAMKMIESHQIGFSVKEFIAFVQKNYDVVATSIAPPRVREKLAELVEKGVLHCESQPGKENVYTPVRKDSNVAKSRNSEEKKKKELNGGGGGSNVINIPTPSPSATAPQPEEKLAAAPDPRKRRMAGECVRACYRLKEFSRENLPPFTTQRWNTDLFLDYSDEDLQRMHADLMDRCAKHAPFVPEELKQDVLHAWHRAEQVEHLSEDEKRFVADIKQANTKQRGRLVGNRSIEFLKAFVSKVRECLDRQHEEYLKNLPTPAPVPPIQPQPAKSASNGNHSAPIPHPGGPEGAGKPQIRKEDPMDPSIERYQHCESAWKKRFPNEPFTRENLDNKLQAGEDAQKQLAGSVSKEEHEKAVAAARAEGKTNSTEPPSTEEKKIPQKPTESTGFLARCGRRIGQMTSVEVALLFVVAILITGGIWMWNSGMINPQSKSDSPSTKLLKLQETLITPVSEPVSEEPE